MGEKFLVSMQAIFELFFIRWIADQNAVIADDAAGSYPDRPSEDPEDPRFKIAYHPITLAIALILSHAGIDCSQTTPFPPHLTRSTL